MRSLLLLFLCFTLSYAKPSKQCELSSDRCQLVDFQPDTDERLCATKAELLNKPQLKTCNEFWEDCIAPPPEEIKKFYCQDTADASTTGPIYKACKKWVDTKYCKPTAAIPLVSIGGFVVFCGLVLLGVHCLFK